tara:strand:+ start:10382 stop:12382 length:2001 start_codon:yes stop_codon:yes gene_type:complete
MDAYGYNALSGFLGSSNMKANRLQELQLLEKMYNLQNQQIAAEQKAQQESQLFIDQSYKIATELTTGVNARKKDRLDIEQLSQDLLTPINEKIRLAGGYQKAKRLGIDSDLRDYQYKLLNNDKIFQMKKNQDAIANIIQLQGSGKGHLINQRDLDSFNNWKSGISDVVSYRGQSDQELDVSILDERRQDEQLDVSSFVYANLPKLASDYAYYIAGNDEEYQRYVESVVMDNPMIMDNDGWVTDKIKYHIPEFDASGKRPTFGRADIKTTLSQELLRGQNEMFPMEGVRPYDLVSQGFGGKGGWFEKAGISPFFVTTFGIDETNPGKAEKDGYTPDFAAKLFTNKETEFRVIDAYFGSGEDGAPSDYYIDSKGRYVFKMSSDNAERLFDYTGSSLKGETSYMDRDADDMIIDGIYLGMKAVYTVGGVKKEKLLMKPDFDLDPTDNAETNFKKLLGEAKVDDYNKVVYKPAYIAQLTEEEIIDDNYYIELNLGDNRFMMNLSDEAQDKKLSQVVNERARQNARNFELQRRDEISASVYSQLDATYATGVGLKQLEEEFLPASIFTFTTNKIAPRQHPFVMADMFDMAQDMQNRSGDEQSFNANVNNIITNFSNLQNIAPDLYRAYQSGKPQAIFDYYKAKRDTKNNGFGEKEYKTKMQRFKLWSKYFK